MNMKLWNYCKLNSVILSLSHALGATEKFMAFVGVIDDFGFGVRPPKVKLSFAVIKGIRVI